MSATAAWGEAPPQDAARAEGRTPNSMRSALAALTLLALALRVTHLGRSLFTYEPNGGPHPIVRCPLTRVSGTSEAVLRAPAVLAGAASVPALWWAARRLG